MNWFNPQTVLHLLSESGAVPLYTVSNVSFEDEIQQSLSQPQQQAHISEHESYTGLINNHYSS